MVQVIDGHGLCVFRFENISGTKSSWIQQSSQSVNDPGRIPVSAIRKSCSFVVTDWREGGEPFCGAPSLPGSAYCSGHQRLCIVRRDSPEGRSRLAALMEEAEEAPEPPPELAHLRESALPEPFPDEVGDLRAVLDHPPPDPGAREPE